MVPVRWDEELREWLMTAEAHEIIDSTKARLMGLLLPDQFKELRERYGYSQKEMGELFQVGEKSWTRWETGKHQAGALVCWFGPSMRTSCPWITCCGAPVRSPPKRPKHSMHCATLRRGGSRRPRLDRSYLRNP
jgi:DNA-binding XRE family transcriptional regulator